MDDLLTVKDVAKMLKVHIMSVYRWVENGKLICCRLGDRQIRFTEEQVDEFVARKNGEV